MNVADDNAWPLRVQGVGVGCLARCIGGRTQVHRRSILGAMAGTWCRPCCSAVGRVCVFGPLAANYRTMRAVSSVSRRRTIGG